MSKMDINLGKGIGDAPMSGPASAALPATDRPVGTILLRDFFMPLAIIGALLALIITLGVHYGVRAFDVANAQREQILAQNGIEKRIHEVAQMVVPQADWDDAIANLDNRFDAAWSRSNMGSFLYQTDGFDRAFVLNSDDALLEAYVQGTVARTAVWTKIAPQAAALIAAVRKAEAARGPFAPGVHETMISRPIQSSALQLVDGSLAIVTATLVQPDFGTALPKGPRAPIVITTMPINDPFLKGFSQRYLLSDLRLLPADRAPAAGENGIPIADAEGRPLANLAWQPLAPGYSMLRGLILPVAAVSALLIALAGWQLWQIRRIAGTLIEREAFWREVASREASPEILDRPGFLDQLAFEIACLGEIRKTLGVLAVRIRPAEQADSPREHERLCQIALSRLRHICRDDAIIARTAEDEFAILAVGADEAGLRALRERARAVLKTPFALDDREIDPEPRLGMAVIDSRKESAAGTLARARADITPDAI